MIVGIQGKKKKNSSSSLEPQIVCDYPNLCVKRSAVYEQLNRSDKFASDTVRQTESFSVWFLKWTQLNGTGSVRHSAPKNRPSVAG